MAVGPPDWVTENCVTGPKGVTDDDGVEAALAPLTFVAFTVNVYAVPAVRPVTVQDVSVAGLGVHVRLPGDDVTVYEVTAAPPLSVGAVQETVERCSPTVAVTPVGAPGTVCGVAEVDEVAVPEPAAFTARSCT